jgi:hypothetical protein
LEGRVEVGKSFGWNPVFLVKAGAYGVGLKSRYETFIDFEFRYVSRKTTILGVPVSRYLSCVVDFCDRIKDRLMRKSGRKFSHPRIPNQR